MGIGPYLCIVDEYAAIVTPGFEVVLTQGRGLGIAAIVASQDYAGILEADKKGAQQMVANTSIKVFMKMQDAEKLAAAIEAYVKKEGYIKKAKNIRVVARYYDDTGNYFTKGQLQIEVQKVDKDGNVVKTKNGSVSVMYLFDCK